MSNHTVICSNYSLANVWYSFRKYVYSVFPTSTYEEIKRKRTSLILGLLFILSPPPCLFKVQEQLEDILVSPGDVIALQHDAGSASLLRCQSYPHSPWRQPVLALNQSEWFWNTRHSTDSTAAHDADPVTDPELDVEALVEDGEGGWLEEVVCPVRVLYVGQNETQLQGAQLSAGLPQPGIYNLLVIPQNKAVPGVICYLINIQ